MRRVKEYVSEARGSRLESRHSAFGIRHSWGGARWAVTFAAMVFVLVGCAARPAKSSPGEDAPRSQSESVASAPEIGVAAGSTSVLQSDVADGAGRAAAKHEAWVSVFPNVWVDRAARRVRVSGFVPIDVHSEKAPRVFLEVLVCSRNTKEHEALVATDAKASHVHAAMLMIGLEPGSPGAWRWAEGADRPEADAPRGPRVRVTVGPEGGQAVEIREWVVQRDGVTRLPAGEHLVFAGSVFRKLGAPGQAREVYGADADGTIVGLTAFGTETIAWTGMYNPDTAVEQPAWIADSARVAKFGTEVEVVIEAGDGEK